MSCRKARGTTRYSELKTADAGREHVQRKSPTTSRLVCRTLRKDHAPKEFVADEDVDNAAENVDPYQDAAENVTEKLFAGKGNKSRRGIPRMTRRRGSSADRV